MPSNLGSCVLARKSATPHLNPTITLSEMKLTIEPALASQAMKAMIAKRAGGGYEPALAELFVAHADQLMAGLDQAADLAEIGQRDCIDAAFRHLVDR